MVQLALYLIIFNSTLLDHFGIANDYSIFVYENGKCCSGFPETTHLYWIGRPLGGFLLNVHLMFLDGIASFRWARIASVVLGAAIASFFVCQLQRDSRPGNGALWFGALVFSLPSCLIYILWLTNFVPGFVAIAFATLAYALLHRTVAPSDTRSRRGARLGGIAALLASFLIYPPNALCYLLLTCWHAYFGARGDLRERLRRVVLDFGLIAGISIAYFLLVKLLAAPLMKLLFGQGARMRPGGIYRVELTRDIGRALRLLFDYTAASAELWLVGWSAAFSGLATIAAILIGVLVWRRRSRQDGETAHAALAALAAVVAMPIAAAPFVLATGGIFAARNLLVPAGLTVFLVFLALHLALRSGVFRTGAFAAITAVAVIASIQRAAASAENAGRELAFVRHALAAANAQTALIVVRTPPFGDRIVERTLYKDFGHIAVNRGLNEGIIRGVLRERGLDPARVEIALVPWGTPEPDFKTERRLLVDFAEAGFRAARELAPTVTRWRVRAAAGNPCCAAPFAFDQQPDTFWETSIGFPVWLELDFPEACMQLRAYSFTNTVNDHDRAPRGWRLLAVERSGEAVPIDSRSDEPAWRAAESRRYDLTRPVCASALRFEFDAGHHAALLRIAEIGLQRNDPTK